MIIKPPGSIVMKKTKGFSAIELMIVVAIVGIIVMVSAGYFGDNVVKANRTEARSALTETSGSLEKCRSLYGSYNAANCGVDLPFDTENDYYSVSATTMAATNFTLTATPKAGGPQVGDDACTTLTLTNTGIRGATGDDVDDCW